MDLRSRAERGCEAWERNRLLAALCRSSPSLRRAGSIVDVRAGAELARAGDALKRVYFPLTGAISVLLSTEAGGVAEAFAVGNEGMLGLGAWLGVPRSLDTLVVQSPGALVVIGARDFCHALESRSRVRRLLNCFVAYSLRFGYQNAVCNAHHSVEQRACRGLLSAADRTGEPRLALTQSLLAQMLGVRRQSVGEVAVDLQRTGLIAYRRNEIEIRDRPALERRACECYRLMLALYRSVMGPLI